MPYLPNGTHVESETEWAERIGRQPNELDRCQRCLGKSNADCPRHGIAACNARQSEFYRRWNERHGD